jgi:aminomuconate-semialdehyde/2-hydroxymuconate-6-semialdehyde dehydrogenase
VLRPPIFPRMLSYLPKGKTQFKSLSSMTALDFVQSLQEMKKSQTQWASLEVSERAQVLRLISQRIQDRSAEISTVLSNLEGWTSVFAGDNQVISSARTFFEIAGLQKPLDQLPKPTGFVSVILPELFSFRILSEKLAPALLAGNGVFVYLPPAAGEMKEIWRSLLDPAWPVRLFDGDLDLAEILVSHPAIHAVTGYTSSETGDRMLKWMAGSWKKAQITAGFHNSALILNDTDVAAAAEQLIHSCFTGMGQLHWNISNILVTEAQLPSFQKEFLGKLETLPVTELPTASRMRLADIKAKLKTENGKALFGMEGSGPLVMQDLSHCSTLQQDCLMAPVVLISPVKYIHEMVRWTNTSYYGMLAQIFGPDEKVQKFGEQLEVSRVLANGWLEKMSELPLGLKQSFSGLSDVHPFGGFYSDLRKIDGLKSKS